MEPSLVGTHPSSWLTPRMRTQGEMDLEPISSAPFLSPSHDTVLMRCPATTAVVDRENPAAPVAASPERCADRTTPRDQPREIPGFSRNEAAILVRRYCSARWPHQGRPPQPRPTPPCRTAASAVSTRGMTRLPRSLFPNETPASQWPVDRR
jgi:hypothetical protein